MQGISAELHWGCQTDAWQGMNISVDNIVLPASLHVLQEFHSTVCSNCHSIVSIGRQNSTPDGIRYMNGITQAGPHVVSIDNAMQSK